MVSPENVGMNSHQLARIGDFLSRTYIEPGKLPGTLMLVARRGRLCYLDAQGLADVERQSPVQVDTIFRIYSMTKPITSMALMMLYERGLFSLSDPVHRYIPSFRDLRVYKTGFWPVFQTVPCERPMTIADLLTHQSGLTYDFLRADNVDYAYRKLGVGRPATGYTLDTMIEQLSELPLAYQPGSCWNYSVATDVVGYLVQVLSGMPFPDYLQQYLFDPLGMNDTAFNVQPNKQSRLASCYMPDENKKLVLQDDGQNSAYVGREYYSGGGGLLSTIEDYYRFCQLLRNNGTLEGERFIGSRTLQYMRRNHLPGGVDLSRRAVGSFSETVYEGVGFGLGFANRVDAVANCCPASEGSYFWGGLASTFFWMDPVEDLSFIFMTQLIPSSTYTVRAQLEAMIYAALDD